MFYILTTLISSSLSPTAKKADPALLAVLVVLIAAAIGITLLMEYIVLRGEGDEDDRRIYWRARSEESYLDMVDDGQREERDRDPAG